MKRIIHWDKTAFIYFRDSIRYVRTKSPQNADKVKKEILQKIGSLSISPEIHPLDKYKTYNEGNYRAFELHHLRISFLVKEHEIIIVRVRHRSQDPLQY